jgi:hypothetical protein
MTAGSEAINKKLNMVLSGSAMSSHRLWQGGPKFEKKKCASHSKLGQICMCRASPWWLSFLHVFEKNNNNKKQNQDKNVDNKIQALSQREPSPCSMSSPRFRATPPPAGPLAPVHQNREWCTQRDRIWRLLLGVCHG